ncbi:RNA polymerase sigma factor [Alteromonas sediminis]|uniref:RNA polymerase sigma factor n=1 Tax=Alteromonas sediminis TaxID=2259342 RepID=A0A3N5YL57_9ALTE|nr:RNA polymerase sigma factor [Alteromonas sediminis]RPJ65801.1 RNA polymerase sigma factor [Alteromonas sediminis]
MPSFDTQSFNALYDTYYVDVYRFCYWLSGNKDDAKDIASETFAKIWTVETELNAKTVKGYLLVVARNLYLQGFKKQNSQLRQEISEVEIVSTADTEAEVEAKQSVEKVASALKKISEPDRSILIMKAYEGVSYQELASIFNMTINTLKTRVHRARVTLALNANLGD